MSMTGSLYDDPELASFYDIENTWAPDFDFCTALAHDANRVLDLGCGTGELATALAEGREVVGVDPATAMLAHASARPGGARVRWIEGDARRLDLGREFDLILLTGHAFQVFLDVADQRAVLNTIHRHLAPRGRFVFDTRNAALRAWESWQKSDTKGIEHPRLGPVTVWTETTWDATRQVARYVKHYRIERDGRILTAPCEIRFDDRPHIETLLANCGLVATAWYGDWHGTPWHPDAPEIIPLGQRA